MSKCLLFCHPTGNANVRAALAGFLEAGSLKEFHTAIAAYPGNLWELCSRTRWGREFQRRKFDERLQSLTVQHPVRELGRILSSRLRLNPLIRHKSGVFCLDAVYRSMDEIVARRLRENPQDFTGVYAFEDGALETLTAARELGLAGNYDLPIGYWRTARKLMEGEFERMPEWADTLTGFKDSHEKLKRKDVELAMATKIIVASSFTASTLKDYPGVRSSAFTRSNVVDTPRRQKAELQTGVVSRYHPLAPTIVVPYGFPAVSTESNRPARGPVTKEKPLRLLFVGSLSQRKGIADLFAAVNILGASVSLTVIGGKVTTDCPVLDKELAKHRWISSLPHERILEEMRAHDVLVFPSLFEGFGLVITEAMSQGTPVVTTERTVGPDLITHGENGWLTKAGSTESLVQQLEKLVVDPEAVWEVGISARQTAAARPWSIYGHELAIAIMKPITNPL